MVYNDVTRVNRLITRVTLFTIACSRAGRIVVVITKLIRLLVYFNRAVSYNGDIKGYEETVHSLITRDIMMITRLIRAIMAIVRSIEISMSVYTLIRHVRI